jgi:Ca-activated chloride channel family protein
VIEGFAPPKNQRLPVNLGLVIDRSGSMRGDRLEKAKEAALMVVDSLGSDDILSIITYDSSVEVLVPPTALHDKDAIKRRIMAISDRGSTALFAGVAAGIVNFDLAVGASVNF